jgi:hypothetical protein
MEKLNNCVICDGIAEVIQVRTGFIVECTCCGETGAVKNTRQEALEIWNSEQDVVEC